MDLQWTLCPFCGNQHIDPYRADLVKTSDIEVAEETTNSTQDVSASSSQDISPVTSEPTLPEPVSESISEPELETEEPEVSSSEA
jgi:hypothetical protein